MKRLLLFLLTVVLVLSCSSDDNSTNKVKKGELTLIANKNEVGVGGYVKFTTMLDNKRDPEAELFINDTRIYTPHMFEEVGVYQVIAKKNGCKDSPPIEIIVKDQGEATLVLSITNRNPKIGDTVNFVVKDNKGNDVENAQIYDKTEDKLLSGFDYLIKEFGTYVFIANAQGYSDSQELVVEVKPLFTINDNQYGLDVVVVNIEIANVIDHNGNNRLVDQVYFLEDGTAANQYVYNIVSRDGDDFNLLSLTLYIENPSIVTNGTEVIDYGSRILPSRKTKVELVYVFAMTKFDFIAESKNGQTGANFGTYDLQITEFKVPNNGLGVGNDNAEGLGDLKFNYKSDQNSINIDYNGILYFFESLPKDSDD
ncbi:hypothetical protein [Myroides injenensis]|uniref:hypothetical protein n=1 Tax=Myroides injenensis TaxID=1183151 RepID=UPI000289D67B|nr:hypothetical protein [Myroides injenensis]